MAIMLYFQRLLYFFNSSTEISSNSPTQWDLKDYFLSSVVEDVSLNPVHNLIEDPPFSRSTIHHKNHCSNKNYNMIMMAVVVPMIMSIWYHNNETYIDASHMICMLVKKIFNKILVEYRNRQTIDGVRLGLGSGLAWLANQNLKKIF